MKYLLYNPLSNNKRGEKTVEEAKTKLNNITSSVVSSEAHRTLVDNQEQAIVDAYKMNIIGAKEFSKQMDFLTFF